MPYKDGANKLGVNTGTNTVGRVRVRDAAKNAGSASSYTRADFLSARKKVSRRKK